MSRRLSELAYARVKSMTRALVERVGGIEAAAMFTRVGRSHIARYYEPHGLEFMPADVVADLEDVAGAPILTRALADLAGYVLFPKPPSVADARWARELGRLAAETGDVMKRLGDSLADDGRISAAEAARIRKEVGEAMAELAVIDATLLEIEDGRAGDKDAEGGR
jgi:hypothetical protein